MVKPIDQKAAPIARGSKALNALVLTFLCGVSLAIGGVHSETVVAAWLAASGLLVATALHRRRRSRPLKLPLPAVLFLVLALVTLLQAVPLPVNLLSFLSPRRAEVALEVAALTGVAKWVPVTYDIAASLVEVAKLLVIGIGLVLGANLFQRRASAQHLSQTVVLLGVALVLIGLITKASGTDRLLFLYRPSIPVSGVDFPSVFVNPNNLAGLLVFAAPLAVALGLRQSDSRLSPLWYVAAGALAIGVLLTRSRGGVLAAFGGVAFAGVTLFVRKRTRREKLFTYGVTAIAGLAALALVIATPALNRLITPRKKLTQEVKIRSWPGAIQMARDHRYVGVGKGAYYAAYGQYGTVQGAIFLRAENQFIQPFADWGYPVALFFLGGLALWFGWALVAGRQDLVTSLFGAGIVALALQNVVDFSADVLGVALPVAVVCGSYHARLRLKRLTLRCPPALGVVVVLLSLGLVVPLGFTFQKQFERQEPIAQRAVVLATTTLGVTPPSGALLPALPLGGLAQLVGQRMVASWAAASLTPMFVQYTRDHPGYYYFPHLWGVFLAEQALWDEALTWLEVAHKLSPGSLRANQLLARIYAEAGRTTESFNLYRYNCETHFHRCYRIALEAFRYHGSAPDFARVTPNTSAGRRVLAQVLLTYRLHERAEKRLREWLDTDKGDPELFMLLYQTLRDQKRWSDAADIASDLLARFPSEYHGYSAMAWLSRHHGQRELALDYLVRGQKTRWRPISYTLSLAEAQIGLGLLEDAGRTLGAIEPELSNKPHLFSHYLFVRAGYYAAKKQYHDAIATLRREMRPSDGLLLLRAELHLKVSEHAAALAICRDVLSRRPNDPRAERIMRKALLDDSKPER